MNIQVVESHWLTPNKKGYIMLEKSAGGPIYMGVLFSGGTDVFSTLAEASLFVNDIGDALIPIGWTVYENRKRIGYIEHGSSVGVFDDYRVVLEDGSINDEFLTLASAQAAILNLFFDKDVLT